jgi:hypothetical protein
MDDVELQLLEDDEVEVPLVEDGGALKSNVLGLLGSITQTGYSVRFQRAYEVHGSMDGMVVNNATLLVVRISPTAKDTRKQFKTFSVSLRVRYDPGEPHRPKPPEIMAYEPGQEGAFYLKEIPINQTRSTSMGGNASVQVPGGVSLGFQATQNLTEEMKKSIQHKVSVKTDYGPGTYHYPDQVTWDLSAADKADGIGDYMVVAMIIRRAENSKFILEIETGAQLGFVSKIFPGKGRTRLGPFPQPTKDGAAPLKSPPGIQTNNIEAFSSTNLLGTLTFVHIPEKVEARKMYIQGESRAVECLSTRPRCKLSPAERHHSDSTKIETIPENAAKPGQGPQPRQTENDSTTDRNLSAEATPFPRAKIPNKQAEILETYQPHQGRDDMNRMKNSRVERLRKMAALYQRLAQLLREEAEEIDGWEKSYALGAEEEEYD